MLDFIKNNIVLVVVAVLAIVIIGYFLLRNTDEKSSFKMFKKRLDESAKPAVATAILNTEDVNNFWNSLGNDLCGKPFNMEKVQSLKDPNAGSSILEHFGLTGQGMGVRLTESLIVAIMKSNMSQDKKIDYIATLFLDELLKSNVPVIKYDKDTQKVTLIENVFREVGLQPSAQVISSQEFGELCSNFMIITLDPEKLKEAVSKRNMPQEARDQTVAQSKKVADAITVEKVCALLS